MNSQIIGLLLLELLRLLIILIVAQAMLSWLIAAGLKNAIVLRLYNALGAFTDPLIRPLRKIIPTFGMLDISPMVAIIILAVLRQVIASAM